MMTGHLKLYYLLPWFLMLVLIAHSFSGGFWQSARPVNAGIFAWSVVALKAWLSKPKRRYSRMAFCICPARFFVVQ